MIKHLQTELFHECSKRHILQISCAKVGVLAQENKKNILPVTYTGKYMDIFTTVQLLVDIHQRKNLLQMVYLTRLVKVVFYSDKAWIALHVDVCELHWLACYFWRWHLCFEPWEWQMWEPCRMFDGTICIFLSGKILQLSCFTVVLLF